MEEVHHGQVNVQELGDCPATLVQHDQLQNDFHVRDHSVIVIIIEGYHELNSKMEHSDWGIVE